MNTHNLFLLYRRALRANLRLDDIQFDGENFVFRKRGFAELPEALVESYLIGRCTQAFRSSCYEMSEIFDGIESSMNYNKNWGLLEACIQHLEKQKEVEEGRPWNR